MKRVEVNVWGNWRSAKHRGFLFFLGEGVVKEWLNDKKLAVFSSRRTNFLKGGRWGLEYLVREKQLLVRIQGRLSFLQRLCR